VFQKEDMLALFKTMSGKPVTIRLLDPVSRKRKGKKKERLNSHALVLMFYSPSLSWLFDVC